MAETVPVAEGGKGSGEANARRHLVPHHPAHHAGRFHELVHGRATTGHTHPARSAPTDASTALTRAMEVESVPESWHSGLQFIMMHESGGRVDARNHASSARGLFQLTAANYHLNPHGAHSFGNAVEEAQGGIHYIEERYGTVDNAVAHWRYRHTY